MGSRSRKKFSTRAVAAKSSARLKSTNLIDVLQVVQQYEIPLLPISPQHGRPILGRGVSGSIHQAVADSETVLAFKQGIPSKTRHDSENQNDWMSLSSELAVLYHPPLLKSPRIRKLLGITFQVDAAHGTETTNVFPMIVTSKSNEGDLGSFLSNKSDAISSALRWQLLGDVLDAVRQLQMCGIAHGDIKPSNFLVDMVDKRLGCSLIDFGACVLRGQQRYSSVSYPWNAPELEEFKREFADLEKISQSDLFSLGLVCIHIIVPITILQKAGVSLIRTGESEDEWQHTLTKMRQMKLSDDGIKCYLSQIRVLLSESCLTPTQEVTAMIILNGIIVRSSGARSLPWNYILERIDLKYSTSSSEIGADKLQLFPPQESVSTTSHVTHYRFDLSSLLGELDDTDYAVRQAVTLALEHKKNNSTCEGCSLHYKSILNACYHIAFGGAANPQSGVKWLKKSDQDQRALDSFLATTKNLYQGTNRVSELVLRQLYHGVLQRSDRASQYRESGRMLPAEKCLNSEIMGRKAAFGDCHRSTIRLITELSQLLQTQTRFEEAETFQKEIVALSKKAYGHDSPCHIIAQLWLTKIWNYQCRFPQAVKKQEDGLSVLEGQLGPVHTDTIIARNTLADTYFGLGDIEKAIGLMTLSISQMKEVLGSSSPLTVSAQLELAGRLSEYHQFDESSSLLGDIDGSVLALLEKNDIYRVGIYLSQASIYTEMRKFDLAVEKLNTAQGSIKRMQLKEDDNMQMDALGLKAAIHHGRHEFPQEEEILRKIASISSYISANVTVGCTTKIRLARNLGLQGLSQEAYALLNDLEESLQPWDLSPDIYAEVVQLLSKTLQDMGNAKEAEVRLEALFDLTVVRFGEQHHIPIRTKISLAELNIATGYYNKAAAHLEPLWKSIQDSRPDLAVPVVRELAKIYRESGRLREAENVCNIALAENRILLSHDYYCLWQKAILGGIFTDQGRLREANSILTEADSRSKDMRLSAYIKRSLSALCMAEGNKDDALKFSEAAHMLYKTVYPKSNIEALAAHSRLIRCKLDVYGLTKEIENEVLENLKLMESVQGTDNLQRIYILVDLASAYRMRCRYQEAVERWEEIEGLGGMDRTENRLQHAITLAKRAELHFDQREYERATNLERRVVDIRKDVLGEYHLSVLKAETNLAVSLFADGKLDESEQLQRGMLEKQQHNLEKANEDGSQELIRKATISLAATKKDLAGVVSKQNRREESLELLRSAVAHLLEIGNMENMVAILNHSIAVIERSEDIVYLV